MTPLRIQRRRVKGWRMPANTIIVDRSSSEFGNPFKVGKATYLETVAHPEPKTEWWVETEASCWRFPTKIEAQSAAVKLFRAAVEIERNERFRLRIKLGLRGRNLACWCKLCDKHRDGKPLDVRCPNCAPCHVDVLGEIANGFNCEEPVCTKCEGGGWVEAYSQRPPAFDVCPACFNPEGHPSP